jgi:hypothetical protein
MFKDGRTNVHDEERSGRPSVVSDDLVQSNNKIFVKDGVSQFQKFRVNFHKFPRTVLYEFITFRLGYYKLPQDGFRKCSWVRRKRR